MTSLLGVVTGGHPGVMGSEKNLKCFKNVLLLRLVLSPKNPEKLQAPLAEEDHVI